MSHPVISSYLAQGGPKLVYHAPASEKYSKGVSCLACLSGNWLAPCDEIKSRTYVSVYENRVEYSAPIPACCCCMCDVTSTVFLDRPLIKNAAPAACCAPAFTHCSFCPTCCDACGEGVVVYGADCCVTRRVAEAGVGSCLPCRGWMMMWGIDNAEELAKQINQAREACKGRIGAGKGTNYEAPKGAEAMAR